MFLHQSDDAYEPNGELIRKFDETLNKPNGELIRKFDETLNNFLNFLILWINIKKLKDFSC